MTPEAAREFTESLGQTLGGGWRLVLWASREGVPEALGMTTRDWVSNCLGGYVRLPVEERREAARELTGPKEEGGEGLSQREAADVLGVSPDTVNRDVRNRTPEPADQDEPVEPVRFRTPAPDPERVARELAEARAARDAREIEEGRRTMTDTVRRAVGVLGNRATLRWLPERFADVQPPIDEDERVQALVALRQLLGGP